MSQQVYPSIWTGKQIDEAIQLTRSFFDLFAGIENKTTIFNNDGSITEITDLYTKNTFFLEDGNIKEEIYKEDVLVATKVTTFTDNQVAEVIL